ncbi:TRAP transporter substrate-binding protein [Nocardioides sp. NPDC051685]|uniref:TRAP transporter substrate-binding protein n=1 Tax=Nocardioides sp. NPDC051685 TaxID=3364334 RepID=UPI00379B2150
MWMKKAAVAASALSLALGLAACGLESGSGSGGETVTIKINTGVPPTQHLNQHVFLPWKEYVEEQTDGRVKVDIYDATTLGSLTTVLTDLESGLYDMGVVAPVFFLDSPLYGLSVGNLIGAVPEGKAGNEIVARYLDAEGDEFTVPGVEIIGASVSTPFQFWGTKPIESIKDIEGLPVRVSSPVEAQLVSILGGDPVQVPSAEMYQALERGTVKAAYSPVETSLGVKIHEVAPHLFEANIASTVVSLGVRDAFLDGLSDSLRTEFEEDLLPKAEELLHDDLDQVLSGNEAAIDELEASGALTVNSMTDEDDATVAAAAEEQWAAWVEEADSKGFDGSALAEQWLTLMDDAGVDRPFEK